MNEIVKYHNNMNLVNFRNFTVIEFNIFFAVCQQMRDKNLSEIELSFEKIKELAKYKSTSKKRLIKDIDNTYKKLLESTMSIENEDSIIRFVLFTKFKIDKNKDIVTIQTNKEFEYILNAITSNFTRFELEEFVSLRKTNSKTVYRMLKQYRKIGFFTIDYQDFLKALNIVHWSRVDIYKEFRRIIVDLKPFFKNLTVEKIKKNNKNTGSIQRLNFMFVPEQKYIGFENIKITKLKEFEIFLLSNYAFGKIIARDDKQVYYFAANNEKKELRSYDKFNNITRYFGSIDDEDSAYYKAIKYISKLKLEQPDTLF